MPFDWKTPFGYLFAIVPQGIDIFCIVLDVAPVVGFMFGSCMLIIAFVEDITSEFKELSTNESLMESQMEMRKRFGNIIQLYSNIKELSNCVNEFYLFERYLE